MNFWGGISAGTDEAKGSQRLNHPFTSRHLIGMLSFKFKHLGVAVSNIEQAVISYSAIFGYRIMSGPLEDPIQNVAVCFLRTEESDNGMIELVAPLNEHSPVSKFLANGIGAYHMCYEVQDMENALAHVRSE